MRMSIPPARIFQASCLAAAMAATAAVSAPPPLPRAVILFIGDGMGTGHVAAARAYAGRPLSFETWPTSIRVSTRSADSPITDSAAAATAMSTGRKVNNGVVSVALPGDGARLETLIEFVHLRGKSAGLVTTTSLTDATPAAFGAHETNRYSADLIGADLLAGSRPEVLLGGAGNGLWGTSCFAAGYTVVTSRDELLSVSATNTPRLAGLFGNVLMPYELDGLGELPHLREMTRVALRVLDTDADGFFLMVEGARIDHAGHANDLPRNIGETMEFENAVNEALTWAQTHPDTLILVTADHETGGLSVLEDRGAGQYPGVQWTTSGHTDTPVGLYAWGNGAGRAQWAADNTEIHAILTDPLFPAPRALNLRRSPSGFLLDWIASSGRVYRCRFTTDLGGPWQPGARLTGTVDAAQSLEISDEPQPALFIRMTDEE